MTVRSHGPGSRENRSLVTVLGVGGGEAPIVRTRSRLGSGGPFSASQLSLARTPARALLVHAREARDELGQTALHVCATAAACKALLKAKPELRRMLCLADREPLVPVVARTLDTLNRRDDSPAAFKLAEIAEDTLYGLVQVFTEHDSDAPLRTDSDGRTVFMLMHPRLSVPITWNEVEEAFELIETTAEEYEPSASPSGSEDSEKDEGAAVARRPSKEEDSEEDPEVRRDRMRNLFKRGVRSVKAMVGMQKKAAETKMLEPPHTCDKAHGRNRLRTQRKRLARAASCAGVAAVMGGRKSVMRTLPRSATMMLRPSKPPRVDLTPVEEWRRIIVPQALMTVGDMSAAIKYKLQYVSKVVLECCENIRCCAGCAADARAMLRALQGPRIEPDHRPDSPGIQKQYLDHMALAPDKRAPSRGARTGGCY